MHPFVLLPFIIEFLFIHSSKELKSEGEIIFDFNPTLWSHLVKVLLLSIASWNSTQSDCTIAAPSNNKSVWIDEFLIRTANSFKEGILICLISSEIKDGNDVGILSKTPENIRAACPSKFKWCNDEGKFTSGFDITEPLILIFDLGINI